MSVRGLSRLSSVGLFGLALGLFAALGGAGCNLLFSGIGGNDNGVDNQNANQNDNGNQNTNQNSNQNGNGNTSPGPDGAALYSAKCAACHGADGTGTAIAPNIVGASAASVTNALANVTLMSSITLTADEVAAIAAFLAP